MTTSSQHEPLYGETYPSTLDEQLSALESDDWIRRFTQVPEAAGVRPVQAAVPFLVS